MTDNALINVANRLLPRDMWARAGRRPKSLENYRRPLATSHFAREEDYWIIPDDLFWVGERARSFV
jgi:hypothetical protein